MGRKHRAHIQLHKPFPVFSSYTGIPVKIQGNIVSILYHQNYPILAAAEGFMPYGGKDLNFLDFPFEHIEDSKYPRWHIFNPDDLSIPTSELQIDHLYPSEVEIIERLKPETLGDIVFNLWPNTELEKLV